MAKTKTRKQNSFLRDEVRRLRTEVRRLKKDPDLDKDEVMDEETSNEPMTACVHCNTGLMSQIEIVGKKFWKCSSCLKTKKYER